MVSTMNKVAVCFLLCLLLTLSYTVLYYTLV